MGDRIVDETHAASSAGYTSAWRSWLASPAVRTLPVLLPALAGFAILQVGKGGDAEFTESDEFLVWSGLNAVTVAAWVAMCFGLLPTVRQLRGLFGDDRPAIPVLGLFGIYALYAALLLAAFTVWAGMTIPLGHYSFRIRTIVAVGLLAAAPTVVTLWLISERLRRLHPLLAAVQRGGSGGGAADVVAMLGAVAGRGQRGRVTGRRGDRRIAQRAARVRP
jgi:hypothetical protein